MSDLVFPAYLHSSQYSVEDSEPSSALLSSGVEAFGTEVFDWRGRSLYKAGVIVLDERED